MTLLQRTRESWQIVFFITAGVYAVGGIIFCILTSGAIQPWAIDKSMITVELDVSATTAKLEVMANHHGDSVDHVPHCRPKSQSNGELQTVVQQSLYMQMLSPYFELDKMAEKKKHADHEPQSNGKLPTVGQESLYMQMLSPYVELQEMAGKNQSADRVPIYTVKSQSNMELLTVGQESLYMQMLYPYFELERTAGKNKSAEHGPMHKLKSPPNGELPTLDQDSLYMQMLSAACFKLPLYDA